ncbi:MAG TPA: sulfatase/phosphatase domain-containing protein, partial [Kofleriaceae bacterium]
RAYKIDTYAAKQDHSARMEEPLEAGMARLDRHLDEARARGEPVLVWMHVLGAHMKGTRFVPDPSFDFGDEPMELYESAVAGMDRWVGAVEERMAARLDPSRPTVWILSADHGTNPTTRSRDLYNPIVRVPLVIVAPGVAPRVDDRPVDVSLDVAATVVDLAGIAPPATYDGVSLVPLLAGLPADALRDRLILMNLSEWSGAVGGRYKYMRRGGVASLYDQVTDPGETHNLIGERFDLAYWIADAADHELARRVRDADAALGLH